MQLLDLEKHVSKNVSEAQSKKTDLLRSVKKEADIQVKHYQNQQQAHFERQVTAVRNHFFISNLNVSVQLEQKINDDAVQNQQVGMSVEEAENDYNHNQNKVIGMLLEQVFKVDCEIPRTLKGDFAELLASMDKQ